MNLFQSIILGIIQGVTEFIPVSSSGHLVLVREFLGWEDAGLGFDIMLHFGTFLAVVFYFRKTWFKLFSSLVQKRSGGRHLFFGLVIATLPAVVVGYFSEGLIEQYFRSPSAVGFLMVIMGLIFIFVEQKQSGASSARSKEVLFWLDYFWIGLAQSIALLPGISRSGATITAGMSRKMSRAEAAEFSFLLAVPAILGATFYDLVKNHQEVKSNVFLLTVGLVVAFSVGYLSIRFLMHYLSHRKLNPFAYYLFILGGVAIIFTLLNKILL